MAVANYHDFHGQYPPAFVCDANGKPMHSWRVLLLPFVEAQDLYDQYDFSQPWDSAANQRLAVRMPQTYAFHGEYRPGVVTTNFLAVVGKNTLWPGSASRQDDDITDSPSATIMLVENAGENVHWMEPRDLDFDTMSFKINDPAGASSKYLVPGVVMLDTSIRALELDLPADVFRALLTVNGDEPVEPVGHSWRLLTDGRLREVDPARGVRQADGS